jgi:hypothetical protein
VLLDQLPYARKQFFEEQFLIFGSKAKANIFEKSIELTNFASQRKRNYWFYNSLQDYLPRRNFMLRLGSLFAAWYLWRNSGNIIYSPKGFREYYKAILNCTPFENYEE